jgi:hypothetical protein
MGFSGGIDWLGLVLWIETGVVPIICTVVFTYMGLFRLWKASGEHKLFYDVGMGVMGLFGAICYMAGAAGAYLLWGTILGSEDAMLGSFVVDFLLVESKFRLYNVGLSFYLGTVGLMCIWPMVLLGSQMKALSFAILALGTLTSIATTILFWFVYWVAGFVYMFFAIWAIVACIIHAYIVFKMEKKKKKSSETVPSS